MSYLNDVQPIGFMSSEEIDHFQFGKIKTAVVPPSLMRVLPCEEDFLKRKRGERVEWIEAQSGKDALLGSQPWYRLNRNDNWSRAEQLPRLLKEQLKWCAMKEDVIAWLAARLQKRGDVERARAALAELDWVTLVLRYSQPYPVATKISVSVGDARRDAEIIGEMEEILAKHGIKIEQKLPEDYYLWPDNTLVIQCKLKLQSQQRDGRTVWFHWRPYTWPFEEYYPELVDDPEKEIKAALDSVRRQADAYVEAQNLPLFVSKLEEKHRAMH